MTIASDSGAAIEAHGRRWRLTMSKLAQIQQDLPVPRELKLLYSVNDILKWASSPRGIDVCLKTACESACDDTVLAGLGNLEKMSLMNELVLEFLGDAGKRVGDDTGSPPRPLQESRESGG